MKNLNELIKEWKHEESIARITGWDFSHIYERFSEGSGLPWDYRDVILRYLKPEMKLLDIDTGGGEFLMSLEHPAENTAATEAYPPNVELCARTLTPLGMDFREADGCGILPFEDNAFDMVINRHGDFNASEIFRILKPGGIFVTQQVGAENDRELTELLLGRTETPFPEQHLSIAADKFRRAGFEIIEEDEAFPPIEFYDVGAMVWFARIIEWEFPGFSVDSCLEQLIAAQQRLESEGCLRGHTHRFMLATRKPLS